MFARLSYITVSMMFARLSYIRVTMMFARLSYIRVSMMVAKLSYITIIIWCLPDSIISESAWCLPNSVISESPWCLPDVISQSLYDVCQIQLHISFFLDLSLRKRLINVMTCVKINKNITKWNDKCMVVIDDICWAWLIFYVFLCVFIAEMSWGGAVQWSDSQVTTPRGGLLWLGVLRSAGKPGTLKSHTLIRKV